MFPITGTASLILAIVFGWLLHRGNVANYGTIVRQLLLKDFTVLKVMLTAIIVGGIGVFLLVQMGYAEFHIKESDLLAITLGAGLFGIGMALFGYCPGTALAASMHSSAHSA